MTGLALSQVPFLREVLLIVDETRRRERCCYATHVTRAVAKRRGVKRHTNFNMTVKNAFNLLHERDLLLFIGRYGVCLSDNGQKLAESIKAGA